MSRIHEALKKAESESTATRSADIATVPVNDESVNHNGSTHSEGILTHASARIPTLGADVRFEDVLAQCAHPEWHPDPAANLFLDSSQHGHSAEQFRTLRSRLHQLRSEGPLRIILVSSAISGEGKTFVSSNLAQAIVRENNRRALLIDADLRCSHQHLVFHAPLKPGLTDYLRGDADEMAIIQQGQGGNLYLVAGGQTVPNPSELLSTGRLKTFLDRIASAFDWVIIDSPPCLPVADARVIADVCDGVLLVVRAGSTSLEVAQRAQQTFGGKKLLGVVLNRVEENMAYYKSYYASYKQTS
jgi:protein-tyrosine kinase